MIYDNTLYTGHITYHRSHEASQSDDSIDKAAAIAVLGDDVSLLDDPLVNAMKVDHVRQQLETLVSAVYRYIQYRYYGICTNF